MARSHHLNNKAWELGTSHREQLLCSFIIFTILIGINLFKLRQKLFVHSFAGTSLHTQFLFHSTLSQTVMTRLPIINITFVASVNAVRAHLCPKTSLFWSLELHS